MSADAVRVLKLHPRAHLPVYMTAGAAGMDLHAVIPEAEGVRLAPGERVLVGTGLAIALPTGFEAQIRPRSGLAHKHGITVLNSPGTIDCDYRGELKVLLVNLGKDAFELRHGERIAQMVIARVAHATVIEVAELDDTARGAGGYGSTGR